MKKAKIIDYPTRFHEIDIKSPFDIVKINLGKVALIQTEHNGSKYQLARIDSLDDKFSSQCFYVRYVKRNGEFTDNRERVYFNDLTGFMIDDEVRSA